MKNRQELEGQLEELDKYNKHARSCHFMMSTQVVSFERPLIAANRSQDH